MYRTQGNKGNRKLAIILLGLTIFLSLPLPRAEACASCGSGTSSPMVLYPNEANKVYFGLSLVNQLAEYDLYGDPVFAARPSSRQSSTIALGLRILPDLSFVLANSLVVNEALSGRSKTGISDPFLEGRYTLVHLSFDRPLQPQVQILSAVKPGWANSVYEYEDPAGLDIFGSGFHEATIGGDLYWGIPILRPGLASTLNYPLPRKDANGIRIAKGVSSRSIVSLASHFFLTKLSLTTGLEYLKKSSDNLDGQSIPDSDSEQSNSFVSIKFNPEPSSEWRLSYSAAASFGRKKNTTRSRSTSLGYARAM